LAEHLINGISTFGNVIYLILGNSISDYFDRDFKLIDIVYSAIFSLVAGAYDKLTKTLVVEKNNTYYFLQKMAVRRKARIE